MRRTVWAFTVLMFAMMAGHAAAAPPVAMVTDMAGEPTADGKAVQLLAELPEGSVVTLSAGDTLTLVYFSSGEEFSLKGKVKGELKHDAVYVSGKRLSGENVLAASAATNLSTTGLSQAAIIMRAPEAPDNPLKLVYPTRSMILESQPLFVWSLAESGYQYRLEIISEDGRSLYVNETSDTQIKLPGSIRIPRGELLTWEIEARRGVQTLYASADFSVIAAETAAQVEQQRPKQGAGFSRQLLFARYLESLGLRSEAQQYWNKLSALRPHDPLLKSKLEK